MRLDRLIERIEVAETVGDPATVEVLSVTEDSRTVSPGTLFCCVAGETFDGHAYAEGAVRDGAVALLGQRRLPVDVAQVVVPSVRPAMAEVAATLHGRPSESLTVIGVTGTNGKTTVTHLLRTILEANGWPTGLLGTLSGARTTQSAPGLQAALAEARDRGERAVAMEVSSHALVQERVDAVSFAAAVFTNLSPDHLDYHRTMEAYFEAKSLLFTRARPAHSIVNTSQEWGRRLAGMLGATGATEGPGATGQGATEGPGATGRRGALHTYSLDDATDIRATLQGTTFSWRGYPVSIRLPGLFNVENALAAATTAAALGFPEDAVAAALSESGGVRGRMERVEAGQPFDVLVDFAHTPDGLERVLRSVRGSLGGSARLAVVFGCGGDRDRSKRPMMGRLAAELADLAVVTSDNPRSEDPLAIIEQVRSGIDDASSVVVEPDRRGAIAAALAWARAGDVVVVAGKGHETGQEIAGVVTPFDDAAVVRELIESGRGERAVSGP